MFYMDVVRKDAVERSKASAVLLQDVDLKTGAPLNIVQSQYKDECDLNVIMGRLTPEQLEDVLAASNGVYGDYWDVMSYGDAKMLVKNADDAFEALPAKIKRKFGNNPEELIEFLDNPENRMEAIELGLLAPELTDKEVVAPVAEGKESES